MNKLAFLLIAAAAAAAAATDNLYPEFVRWTKAHRKLYSSPEEHVQRFANYQANYELVKSLNAIGGSANFALNKFADMSLAEFSSTYLRPMSFAPKNTGGRITTTGPSFAAYPDSLDWRIKGAVNNIKDQGSCGSCWAFSTVANLEGAYFVAHNILPKLSDQQLVDCDHGCMVIDGELCCNQGCNGGLPLVALQYVKKNGMMSEADYAYSGTSTSCKYDATKAIYKFADSERIDSDEDSIVAALNKFGPVSVGVDATYWSFYNQGVYDTLCSSTALNHGVAIVGYGAQGDIKYWIIRNSWGTGWGENGYMKLIRGKNKCGVNNMPTTIVP